MKTSIQASLTVHKGLRSQLTARVKQSGEVFTPVHLVRQMLDRIPESIWRDPNKTWLESSAGDGNFLVEIQAKLLAIGHDPIHVLENALFSVEIFDDNFWFLQHRLGYLIDGQPNPVLNHEHFEPATIDRTLQDLNHKNPFEGLIFNGKALRGDQVLQHRNHICASALLIDLNTAFGERETFKLPLLPKKAFSWDKINTEHLWPSDASLFSSQELDFIRRMIEAGKSQKYIESALKTAHKTKFTPELRMKIAEMLS